jgi:glycosyltransferase involved in cell wall biosynthesis
VASIHIITPEYFPRCGGVADYTRQVARGLANEGDEVHVWCPEAGEGDVEGVTSHGVLGSFGSADLARAGVLLDAFEPPRRLLVQWVPHGYGYRAMNLPFCLWLLRRSRRGDAVELMVHEAYLHLWEGTWRQTAAAAVHRVMTIVLLQAATRVWVSIPAWENMWRPYVIGRTVPFKWLPVPSVLDEAKLEDIDAARIQRRRAAGPLVGHLGTYGGPVAALLHDALQELLRRVETAHVLLIGSGSHAFRDAFVAAAPQYSTRLTATGELDHSALAANVAACDVLLQPYPDGVTSRRTTAMAALRLGVPLVTTIGRLTEPTWQISNAVRLSPVGDCCRLAGDVEHLLRNPRERLQMANAARELYERTFDLRHTIDKLKSSV